VTPEQLGQLVDNLRRFEGASPWMYLDTHDPPLVTVGIGVMLPTVGDAVALPFRCIGADRGATENEVAAAYARVKAMRGGMGLHYYQGITDIELPDSEVTALAERRLTDVFLPGARAAVPGFEALPWPAQQALVDIEWNAGGLKGWPKLCAAVARRDWSTAAIEGHVSTSRPERNAWRAQMFLSC
jgi:hypothetical protein